LGTYDELLNSGIDFMSLLEENNKVPDTRDRTRSRAVSELPEPGLLRPRAMSRQRSWSGQSESLEIPEVISAVLAIYFYYISKFYRI
jgi:hypothetical protein